MNKKLDAWKIIMISSVVAVIAFLFLDFASVSYQGEKMMSLTGFGLATGKFTYMGTSVTRDVSIDAWIIIIGAVMAFIGAFKTSKKISLIGAIAALLICVLNLLDTKSKLGGVESAEVEASIGIGIIIAVIGFATAVVFGFKAKKQQSQDQQSQQQANSQQ